MKILLLLLALILFNASFAQTGSCGTDAMHDYLKNRFPEYREKENQNNQLLYHFLTSENVHEKTIYTIPIVFHIMHQGGPEANVSDATIIQGVNELNQRFQNAGPFFDATGHAIDIQFCLASVDPWGNPTTGITHDSVSIISVNFPDYYQDWAFKTQNRWNPLLYLNVWSVGNIVDLSSNPGGVGGYSAFPGNLIDLDGIVARYTIVGVSSLLVHEIGHYLNLYHTWTDVCTNFNCMLDGDKVCDTPPDNSNNVFACPVNSCSTEMSDTSGFNPFSSDMPDLPNYMDYSSCPLSFSQGQADRMLATLTQLRPTLLQSNGCGMHPGGAMPVAAFTVDSSFCKGTGKYGFTSTSANCLYAAWDFDNNGSIDTVGAQVTHRFSSSGYYSVKLYAGGYGGTDTLTQTIYVFVAPSPSYPISGSISGTTVDPIMHIPYACIGAQVTLGGTPGMSSYLWSNGATTQNTTFTIDSTSEYSLTVTTPSGEQLHSCTVFKIGVNPRIHLAFQAGSDTVDCGDLITLRWYPIPYWFPATNTWYRNGSWFSANQTVLSTYGPVGDQHVWVANNVDPIGCVTHSDTIHFFMRDPVPISLSFDGTTLRTSYDCPTNQWFRDGVQLTAPNDSAFVVTQNGCYWGVCLNCAYLTTDTICITNLSMNEQLMETEIKLFPNPFSEAITIQFSIPQQNTWVDLLDPTGKLVRSTLINGSDFSLKRENLATGAYLIRVHNELNHLDRIEFVVIE
ncbi:MAG: M43 family zinc metalloprotease [Fluviicola sp.]